MIKTTSFKVAAAVLIFLILPVSFLFNIQQTQARAAIIVIDPGHGGSAPGAIGPTGLKEKDVNLSVALRLRKYLTAAGAKVVMTRTTDKYVSLSQRVSIANSSGADRFISIHHNSSVNRTVNGTETYAYHSAGSTARNLGAKVQNALIASLGLSNRGFKTASFYVIRYTKMPSILTEGSFISNKYEEARLKSSSYLDKEARAIYNGIRSHMRLGSNKDALGLSGTSSPQKVLYLPKVDDSSSWNGYICLRNTSNQDKAVKIKLRNKTGSLLHTRNVTIKANGRYHFYPRKILNTNFNGSVSAATDDNSFTLTGYYRQTRPKRSTVGISKAVSPATNQVFPRVIDTASNWKSRITILNTNDVPITVNAVLAGGGEVTRPISLSPYRRYDFYPRVFKGSDFTGLIKLSSAQNFTSALTQSDKYSKGLALMPGQAPAQDLYLPYVYDKGTFYRSNVVITNTSESPSDFVMKLVNFSGVTEKQIIKTLLPNRSYSFSPKKLKGSDFFGMIALTGSSAAFSARLTTVNRTNDAVSLTEPQPVMQNHHYGGVYDGSVWDTLISVRDVSGASNSFNLQAFSPGGTISQSWARTLGAYKGANYSPFKLTQAVFSGNFSVNSTNGGLTTALVISN